MATPGPSSHRILHLLNFNIQNTNTLFSMNKKREKRKNYHTKKKKKRKKKVLKE